MLLRYLFPQEKLSEKPRIYLDHAAAAPLVPSAQAAMEQYLSDCFANPSAIHTEGQQARQVISKERQTLARCLEVKEEQVAFTSGGTESNQLAILGIVEAAHQAGRKYSDMECITTELEHPSVLGAMELLRERGVTIHYAPVTEVGEIDQSRLVELLNVRTVLVSVALVNSEIGTIADTRRIARLLKKEREAGRCDVRLHVDAAQAPLWLPVALPRLGADVVSFDAGKCGGPKGIGLLAWGKSVELEPVVRGGGQEFGLRPGTESVLLIAGASAAFLEAQEKYEERAKQVRAVRDAGIDLLLKEVPKAVLNGPEGDGRVANNINISILGLDTEFAVVVLDKNGIAASTKSACSGAGAGESRVVRAISGDPAQKTPGEVNPRAASTIRLTLNSENTVEDLKRVAEVLKAHIQKMQQY